MGFSQTIEDAQRLVENLQNLPPNLSGSPPLRGDTFLSRLRVKGPLTQPRPSPASHHSPLLSFLESPWPKKKAVTPAEEAGGSLDDDVTETQCGSERAVLQSSCDEQPTSLVENDAAPVDE